MRRLSPYSLILLILLLAIAGCAAKGQAPKAVFSSTDYNYLKSLPYKTGDRLSAENIDKMWALLYLHNDYMLASGDGYISNENALEVMRAMPQTIAGVSGTGTVMSFELDSPGLGYSMGYIDPVNFKNITIYSYHDNQKEIPSGVDSEVVEQGYINSVRAIAEAKVYGQVSLMHQDVYLFADIPFVFAAFELPEQGYWTHIFFTGYNNTFVKVRYDCIPTDENIELMGMFVDEVAEALKTIK